MHVWTDDNFKHLAEGGKDVHGATVQKLAGFLVTQREYCRKVEAERDRLKAFWEAFENRPWSRNGDKGEIVVPHEWWTRLLEMSIKLYEMQDSQVKCTKCDNNPCVCGLIADAPKEPEGYDWLTHSCGTKYVKGLMCPKCYGPKA